MGLFNDDVVVFGGDDFKCVGSEVVEAGDRVSVDRTDVVVVVVVAFFGDAFFTLHSTDKIQKL